MKLTDVLLHCSIVDLTHELHEDAPVWPDGVVRFERQMIEDYHYKGYRCFSFSQSEGVGTHMDAPAHFLENGKTISDIECSQLVAPACVIDVRKKAHNNHDYAISAEDILHWEKQHGKIGKNSLVLGLTGWSQYWLDNDRYLNQDTNGIMHFPGFSEDAATILIEKRKVSGIGIDTLSIDPGAAEVLTAHKVILHNNRYQIENMAHLDKLPPQGAVVIALPIKIKGGSEAPTRVIALIPNNL